MDNPGYGIGLVYYSPYLFNCFQFNVLINICTLQIHFKSRKFHPESNIQKLNSTESSGWRRDAAGNQKNGAIEEGDWGEGDEEDDWGGADEEG